MNITRAEKWTAIIVVLFALILLAQISANTGPSPDQPCMKHSPDGVVPCATS